MTQLRILIISLLSLILSGCQLAILNPKGLIAASEKSLLVDATLLMLIVVIPVIILSFLFTWKYRARNTKANYSPDWSHSTLVEVICWTIPCIIIGILAIVTWITTHRLDPYRPLNIKGKPIIIEAVALNWKWLFIYPKQNIATINYLQIPVHVPIRFMITADAPMNSLEIPQLAGQIYAMTGMRTKLNLIANQRGSFSGMSTNFSGDGFSGMRFIVKATSMTQFNDWVRKVQQSPKKLSMTEYTKLTKNSKNNPVQYFSSPAKHLLNKIIMKYMGPNMKMTDY